MKYRAGVSAVVVLFFAGCGRDGERAAQPVPAVSIAEAKVTSPVLQFRAQDLPFRYERGETAPRGRSRQPEAGSGCSTSTATAGSIFSSHRVAHYF